jgi:hypothetical protein
MKMGHQHKMLKNNVLRKISGPRTDALSRNRRYCTMETLLSQLALCLGQGKNKQG